MKTQCVLSVLICTLCAAVATQPWRLAALKTQAAPAEVSAFTDFISKFGKKYDSNEMVRRFAVFKQALATIAQHNAEYAEGKHTYTLGINAFADLTVSEWANMKSLTRNAAKPAPSASPVSAAPVPPLAGASLDWRTKNAVNPIKDQGQCGSCWSFSATVALEGVYALETGKLTAFSEQMCLDCANGGKDTCNRGGEMSDCYDYVLQVGGEQLQSDYPYKAAQGTCATKKDKLVGQGSFTQNYTAIPLGDENALFNALNIVPTAIALYASNKFQMYSSGVYEESGCKTGYDQLNHGVALVGYGTEGGKDYYILRNSWGTSWGLSGYMKIVRGKNMCGLAVDASYFVPSNAPPPPPPASSTAAPPPPPPPPASSSASPPPPPPPPPASSTAAPPPPPPPVTDCKAYANSCTDCTANGCEYCGAKTKVGHCATAAEAAKNKCNDFFGWVDSSAASFVCIFE